MKKLSDYTGEEAIDLWADLMQPAAKILADQKVAQVMKGGKPPILIVHTILKNHKKEAIEMLTRIDDTPINGVNAVTRLLSLLGEIMEDESMQGFFDMQGQGKDSKSSGSLMGNTVASEMSDVS